MGEKAEVEDGEINDPTSATKPFSSSNPFVGSIHLEVKSNDVTKDDTTSEIIDEPKQTSDVRLPSPARQHNVLEKPLPHPQSSNPSELPSKPETKIPGSGSSVPPRPPRPDMGRNPSDISISGRQSHTLPTRPDLLPGPSRIGEKRSSDRLGERSSRDGRDGRFSESGRRGERVAEPIREQIADRHGSYRTHDRPTDRLVHNDREKQDIIWGGDRPVSNRITADERYNMYSRDPRPPFHDERVDRTARERQHIDSYETSRSDGPGHGSRDSSMPPPRPSLAPHPDRAGLVHATMDSDRTHGGTHPDRRGELQRIDEDGHQDAPRGSRTASPSRRDDRSSRSNHHHRDDRPPMDNRRPLEENPPVRPRYDEPRPPTGPRHINLPQSSAGDRFREIFKPSSNVTAPPDSSLGRLSQDSGKTRHQESQYGRLNTDPPSGPRTVNGNQPTSGRGARGVLVQNSQLTTQAIPTPNIIQSSTTPDKQTPTGPASGRLAPRNTATYNRPPPISTSAPPVSSTESPDTAGVHPDRLKSINFAVEDTPEFAQPLPNPPIVSVASSAPAGPRVSSSTQSSSPVTGSRPNTGLPGFGNGERARGDKRFTNLNNVLQQAGGTTGPDRSSQGASIRGRSMRTNNLPTPPIPSIPPRRDSFVNSEQYGPSRQELFSTRPSSGPNTPQRDDDMTHAHGPPRDGDRRMNRRRDGRSQSPRRHSALNPMLPVASNPRDDLRSMRRMDEQRDHRPRVGGPLPMTERERRVPRDDIGGPIAKDRERRDGDRRDEWTGDRMGQDRRERDRREPSGMDFTGNGRKRPRGPEDAYDIGKRSRRIQ